MDAPAVTGVNFVLAPRINFFSRDSAGGNGEQAIKYCQADQQPKLPTAHQWWSVHAININMSVSKAIRQKHRVNTPTGEIPNAFFICGCLLVAASTFSVSDPWYNPITKYTIICGCLCKKTPIPEKATDNKIATLAKKKLSKPTHLCMVCENFSHPANNIASICLSIVCRLHGCSTHFPLFEFELRGKALLNSQACCKLRRTGKHNSRKLASSAPSAWVNVAPKVESHALTWPLPRRYLSQGDMRAFFCRCASQCCAQIHTHREAFARNAGGAINKATNTKTASAVTTPNAVHVAGKRL